jgi:hypothetical protein
MVNKLVGTPPDSGTLTATASSGSASVSATITYTGVTVQVSAMTATYTGLALTGGSGSATLSPGGTVTAQASVSYLGNTIPVGCSAIHIFRTDPTGGIDPSNQSFTIVEGQTGPPCGATLPTHCDQTIDRYGNDPAADAAQLPCPPTAAQASAGVMCDRAVGDVGGDVVAVPISYNVGAPPLPTTTTTAPYGSSSIAAAPAIRTGQGTVSGSSGSLAFTGTGPHLAWLALLGIALIILAASCSSSWTSPGAWPTPPWTGSVG